MSIYYMMDARFKEAYRTVHTINGIKDKSVSFLLKIFKILI